MDNEIQLISDGDGLAVIGKPKAVERFIASASLSNLPPDRYAANARPPAEHSLFPSATSALRASFGRYLPGASAPSLRAACGRLSHSVRFAPRGSLLSAFPNRSLGTRR